MIEKLKLIKKIIEKEDSYDNGYSLKFSIFLNENWDKYLDEISELFNIEISEKPINVEILKIESELFNEFRSDDGKMKYFQVKNITLTFIDSEKKLTWFNLKEILTEKEMLDKK